MNKKSVWNRFGFNDNPYKSEPLAASDEDFELFTSRSDESAKFATLMSCNDGCVIVVSGEVGVGKTSFVNVQQHVLATGKYGFGPKLLPCLRMTSPDKQHTPVSLAQALVHNSVLSVVDYCKSIRRKVPEETRNVSDWLSHKQRSSGYQLTVGLVGAGFEHELPAVADATLPTWCEVLKAVAHEVRNELQLDGIIVCLDNVETLTNEELVVILMAYRDNLFSVNGVWWVIVGRSKLYYGLDALDRRVSQRIRGDGVEIPPFTSHQFHDLIERRIRKFSHNLKAKSPLTNEVHTMLFNASCGQVRFALDTADSLLNNIVAEVHAEVFRGMGRAASSSRIEQAIDDALLKVLVNEQIPNQRAFDKLKEMSLNHLMNQRLTTEDVAALRRFKQVNAGVEDFKKWGFPSGEAFLAKCLNRLVEMNLLAAQETNGGTRYVLKGFARLAVDLGVLGNIVVK